MGGDSTDPFDPSLDNKNSDGDYKSARSEKSTSNEPTEISLALREEIVKSAPNVTIEQVAQHSDRADRLFEKLKSLEDQLGHNIREQYVEECIHQELESRGLNISDIQL